MSLIYEDNLGYFISHADFIEKIYENVNVKETSKSFKFQNDLFEIKYPYKKLKTRNCLKRKLEDDECNSSFRSEVDHVKNLYSLFYNNLITNEVIQINSSSDKDARNEEALAAGQNLYDTSGLYNVKDVIGENTNEAIEVEMQGTHYIFPENCKFYCSAVNNITKHLENEKFDVILLDPPWWNKYIRRKKAKVNDTYAMMYNDDLKGLPIEDLISETGLVIVWCTNSTSHLSYLKEVILEKWKVKYMRKWYWMKVTIAGEPICNFSEPPGKQPFEQIVFAARDRDIFVDIPDERLVVSVPSALHSHKPPLEKLLQKFLPVNSKRLEIFARYLLPNWTSYGLEAIRFQHCSLYEENNNNS
ncbi:n6-adenosine-methyltransferase [Holotrichia oblita]|uniref:N6-adenosine-methyltransferase n=1 Tax=Holotrichia oblita TaxID=644536 RepID=A0ACB9TIK0_HOLOL|nr:n6-adenosine-methyltransferase [Holotrichia oblita]